MRVSFLVFDFVVFVLALASMGEGADGKLRDDCIIRFEEKKLTFENHLDGLFSQTKADKALEVEVTHTNTTKCTLTFKKAEVMWVKARIQLVGYITATLNETSPINGTGGCSVPSDNSSSIKTVKIKHGLSVFACNDGPAVIQVNPNMNYDYEVIPWYNGTANFTLTPLADTNVLFDIGDHKSLSVFRTKDGSHAHHVAAKTIVHVNVSRHQYSSQVQDLINKTDVEVNEVRVYKHQLSGPVIVKQLFGTPEPRESPASTWLDGAIPAATGILGMILGVFLVIAVQRCQKTQKKTAVDSSPVSNDEGRDEVINDLYEPFDEAWARPRQQD